MMVQIEKTGSLTSDVSPDFVYNSYCFVGAHKNRNIVRLQLQEAHNFGMGFKILTVDNGSQLTMPKFIKHSLISLLITVDVKK